MIDKATTTTTTAATAANLDRGGVRNDDSSFAVNFPARACYDGPCNKNRNEKACLSGTFTKGCTWHWTLGGGRCSSCVGVNCGNHRSHTCRGCPFLKGEEMEKNYCNGECTWDNRWDWRRPLVVWSECYLK